MEISNKRSHEKVNIIMTFTVCVLFKINQITYPWQQDDWLINTTILSLIHFDILRFSLITFSKLISFIYWHITTIVFDSHHSILNCLLT